LRSVTAGWFGAGLLVIGAWAATVTPGPTAPGVASTAAAATAAASKTADPHQPLSSDGRALPAVGTARALTGAVQHASTGSTGAVLARRASVIGTDDRVRNTDTTTYPNRAVVQVLYPTPTGTSVCTGWMINRNTVATAGHCVYAPGQGFLDAGNFQIVPGRNGSTRPYGTCGARRLFTVSGWASSGAETLDYGAIKLNCNVGDTVGWFGMFTTTASLNGTAATITGYPADKPTGTQWAATRTVVATDPRQVFYDTDTAGGNSGSPVWAQNTASCSGSCAYAIHAYGLHGSGNHLVHNHGTRITQDVFDNLMAWARSK
jgi:glutamyl endopeptidase